MADILIRYCTVRVVRRDGWAWGRAPRALVDRVLECLPAMIADEMAQLWPDDADHDLVTPLRFRVQLSPDSAARAARFAKPHGSFDDAQLATLSLDLRAALHDALEIEGARDDEPKQSDAVNSAAQLPVAQSDSFDTMPAVCPLELLVRWLREGSLQDRLRTFTFDALKTWHAHVLLTSLASADTQAVAELNRRLGERLAQQPPCVDGDAAATLRLRLQTFATLETMLPSCTGYIVLRETVEQALPWRNASADTPASRAADRHATTRVAQPSLSTDAGLQLSATAPRPFAHSLRHPRRAAPRELRIECALPFLMLGPLVQTGYLDTACAALAAAGIADALPLFAAALACKSLEPPARGWRRTPAARATAAACSLLPEPPDDSEIHELARVLSAQTSPLDACVESCLLSGHRPGCPFLLSCTGSTPANSLILWDIDGMFPIAIIDDPAASLPRMLHELILIPADTATLSLLATLDAANLPFITDATPCRGESWRRVTGRSGERWWSNERLAAEARLADAAGSLADAAVLAQESWHALGVERPALSRQADEAFDRSLTLAAGLALGTLAWELWRERESTFPSLALARFHDLSAVVRIDHDSVHVLLPRGRRFCDLRDHGLLDDVTGVPWFEGRTLRFTSG